MLEDKQEMIGLLTGVKSSKKNYYTQLKKTVEQLKKKNMQLEIINDVMKSIQVDTSFEDILKNVTDKLKTLFHFERLSLLLLQNEQLVLTNVYPESNHYLEIGDVIPNKNSLYWLALQRRQIIFQHVNDPYTTFYEKQFLANLNIQTVLLLPIYSKNKGIGILSIGKYDELKWSIDELSFLEQLTDHLAVSIENAQLYNEVLQGKQQWEDTFKAVDDMIIVFDKDSHILQCNDSAKHFFNKENHVVNFSLLQDHCRSLIQETFMLRKPGYTEMYLYNDSICEVYTYPIHNNEFEVYGVIAYIKDVTEKRKMEVQLLHSGKLAAIGEMAAGIAHELNSPLTAILGNSQLLLRNVTSSEPSFVLLNDIKNCGQRSKRIIQNLLTFSRQDEYVFTDCSLNDAVEVVLNLLKYQLEKSQITIKQMLKQDLPPIEASQPQIEQVIINLILNAKDALEYCPKEHKGIIIETSLQENEVHLSVTDNGVGIEESKLPRIFHPFYTTKETEKGTGLGLSVSIGIVKTHRGTIDVHSKLHHGSTFTLKLPVQQSKASEVTP
ncbi:ATP-binding protein [Microbacteriaceae bacterium 4G12]